MNTVNNIVKADVFLNFALVFAVARVNKIQDYVFGFFMGREGVQTKGRPGRESEEPLG